MPFEPKIPGYFEGTIDAVVLDPAGQVPARTIIQIPDEWRVRVRWTVTGLFVPSLDPNAIWHVKVFVESLGPGIEAQVGSLDVPVGPSTGLTHTYAPPAIPDVIVPANFHDPDGRPLTPGPYKLVTVLTIDNGGVPWPIAGYVDGPVVQFYQYP